MVKGIFRELLKELISQALSKPDGIDALKFRANHEEHLDQLDKLEKTQYIKKVNGKYQLTLVALAEFEKEDVRVDSILYRCEHIFSILRKMYKESPGLQISLDQFVTEVDLPAIDVRKGLAYMIKAPIFSRHSEDMLSSRNVFISPSENILKYKTFQDVINQLCEYAKQSTVKYDALLDKEKDFPIFLHEIDRNGTKTSLSIPPWHQDLPPVVKSLLEEVYYGLQKEMKALPSMGLRTIIDVVCMEFVGDIGGFAKKLNQLEKNKHITPQNKELLESALEVGHASAHRGHFPELTDLNSVLDIVNHLLNEVYILKSKSLHLKSVTPLRKRNNK
jgi:hypothetical protein